MSKKAVYPKVAFDMGAIQAGWTIWFLGIITIIHIVKAIVSIKMGGNHEGFFVSSFVSSNIYMFIIGIIGLYAFLPFFVKNGVTRKDYFIGSIFVGIGLSVSIVLYSLVLSGIETAVIKMANLPINIDNSGADVFSKDEDDILIAKIVKMIVVSPFVGLEDNWFLSLILTSLNLISSYVMGGFIAAGYYRYGWIAGFGFIGMSILLMIIWDLIWGSELGEPLASLLGVGSFDFPTIVSILGSVAIISLVLWMIRRVTRRVVIKL
ncbi:hypothetical protein [Bacillus marasmi]|uniref:hypothetical protein n=1 Tax=Bacillus marasmi TaxID=1926279 RepID=UPI0011C849DE|nr:hypothetical protein [Bacillus marasmi]